MSTGENIQYLRKRDGYTQERFAEELGVSRQTISKWESDSCFPEMDKLLLMCDMFRCKLDDLVRGDVQAETAKDTAYRIRDPSPGSDCCAAAFSVSDRSIGILHQGRHGA